MNPDYTSWVLIPSPSRWYEEDSVQYITSPLIFESHEPILSLTIMKPGEKYSVWTRRQVASCIVFEEQTSLFNPDTWTCNGWELQKLNGRMWIVKMQFDLDYPVDTRIIMRTA